MPRLAFVLLALAPLWAAPSLASDQERAKAALERGEIRPLDEVLKAVRVAVPGDVVALELRRKEKRWQYKLKILTPAGKRRELRIDASTLEIVDDDGDDED